MEEYELPHRYVSLSQAATSSSYYSQSCCPTHKQGLVDIQILAKERGTKSNPNECRCLHIPVSVDATLETAPYDPQQKYRPDGKIDEYTGED